MSGGRLVSPSLYYLFLCCNLATAPVSDSGQAFVPTMKTCVKLYVLAVVAALLTLFLFFYSMLTKEKKTWCVLFLLLKYCFLSNMLINITVCIPD